MAAEGRPEEGGPRRPVAPGSPEDTRGYRLRKPHSGFRPAPPAGPGAATDSLGVPRPVRLCLGRPAGPRQVSGPAAGRRRGKGRPPRRLTGPPDEGRWAPRGTTAPSRSAGGGTATGKAGTARAALGKPRSVLLPLPHTPRPRGTCQRQPPLPYLLPPPPARPRSCAGSARSVRAAAGGAARGTGSNRRVWGGPRRCHVTARAANGRGRRRR